MQYPVLDIILYPGHLSLMCHNIVDLQSKFDHFNDVGVEVDFFFNQLVIIITINLDVETVFRFGLVIDPDFCERS